uniref:Peptidase C2 calpain domain-containing protein n=1 Tax=Clastoptera arizonana TaxID=38151 RepID=A0A1B6C3V2_9HEMI
MNALPPLPYQSEVDGVWKQGESDGGSRNNLELFSRNPQYLLTFKDKTSFANDRFSKNSVSSTMTLCHITLERKQTDRATLHIAFFVYETDNLIEVLPPEYFLCVSPTASSGSFVNRSKVEGRYKLKIGAYMIIPATFLPFSSGTFTLTVSADYPLMLTSIS